MITREDDPSIGDETLLWRRIIPAWLHQEEDGTWRPESAAFRDDYTGEVSVHIAPMTTADRLPS